MSTTEPENEIEPEDVDQDDPDTDEDAPEGDKPYKPPTEGEWNRLQRRIAKLTKAAPAGKGGGSATDRALRAQLDAEDGKSTEQEDSQGDHWRGVAIQNAAAAQISAAGFSGTAKQAARLARLIDTAGLEPDRHGSFDLEDEIADLKDEYPQLFSTGGDGRRTPRVRTAPSGDRTPVKDPTATTSERMMKQAGYR